MDSMMFPASGYGPLPPSAMAEIEKRMAAAMRNSNFQKMLELEKKHKMERLHSAPASPPPPAPPVEHQEISLQVRRADSLSQQQNHLMLKAVRRSVVLPSLSIDIPQPPSIDALEQSKGSKLGTGTDNGNHDGNGSSTVVSVEPLQKQVKFLAPDDDEMSDQSSICQSPSWEGYGQRKKEKKKEAERRRKEKEQAEKDARAAKRRPAARLSKSPPPGIPGRAYRASGLTSAERSMSDPLLVSQYLQPETQCPDQPGHIERTISADDLQNFGHYQPAVAEVLSDAARETRQFVGGVKLDREREAVLQRHLSGHGQQSPTFPHHLIGERGTEAQSASQSSRSEGPVPSSQQPQHASSTRQESRAAREMFPPSASRTPMLRQVSAPTQHTRNQGFLQGATKIFRGKDGKDQGSGDLERGRKGVYVQHQREQSMERSIAETAYEQLVNNGSIQSSSTRSSSRNTQHRRSSFTQEARSVAMKLAGIKPTPSGKEESRTTSQSDYFNYLENTSASSGHGGSTPSDTRSIATRNQDVDRTRHVEGHISLSAAALRDVPSLNDRPPTAQSAVSSNNPSIAGSNSSTQSSRKNQSLRDAAKAPFTGSRGPHPQQSANPTRQTMLAPPYQTFRGRLESQALAPEERAPPPKSSGSLPLSVPPHGPGEQAKMPLNPLVQTSTPSTSKPSENNSQAGSRASEGSSSSSAYEDGSPLPSPVSTPDTSRPQSSKDLPYIVGEITKGTGDKPWVQDDDATLRQPSSDSSTSTTPRLVKSESQESPEMADEDRWSRTALPIDIDTDSQSFTTSFSNLDHLDNIDEALTKADTSKQATTGAHEEPSPARTLAPTVPERFQTKGQLVRASADQDDTTIPVVPPIMPPPRSKKRGMSNARRPSSPQSVASPEGETQSPGKGSVGDETTGRPAYPDSVLLRGVKAEDARSQREETVTDPLVERERAWDPEKQIARREKGRRKFRHESTVPQRPPTAPDREATSTGAFNINTENDSTDVPSNGSMPPEPGSNLSLGSGAHPASFPSSPYVNDFHESTESRYPSSRSSSPGSKSLPSPASPQPPRIASPAYQPVPKSPGSTRFAPSAQPSRPSSAVSNAQSAPSASRLANTTPVSILKQPAPVRSTSDPVQSTAGSAARAPILSALPKHMQQQAGMSVRTPVTAPEARMAPIAKMFVECCNCKFYHDMPSKLYECMAKPDAVVEDRLLGISGAITTMVKCPWCQHNMSTSCCAGYAAVVYLKEKLH